MIAIIITCVLAFVCLWFLHGINKVSPSTPTKPTQKCQTHFKNFPQRDKAKMMPYIIQNGVFGLLFLGAAAYFFSLYFLLKSLVLIYITVCAYSLYQVFAYEDAQKHESEKMNANMNEFSQGYEIDGGAGGENLHGP
jgi:hypothetical protein